MRNERHDNFEAEFQTGGAIYALHAFIGVKVVVLCCAVIPLLLITAFSADVDGIASNGKLIHAEQLLSDFQKHEFVAVIVNLKPPETNEPTDWTSTKSLQLHHAANHAAEEAMLKTLDVNEHRVRFRFENQAGFSCEVTQPALQKLLSNPNVESIEPVQVLQAHLAQGIPLMNALASRSTYDGAGVAIAICDTGIDYNHARLGGGGFPNSKVLGGYDFGDNDADPIPNGQAHGTSCAGIAAGDLGTVGDYIGGVAPAAKLYALKISYGSSGSASNDAMVAAWNWCVTHRNDNPSYPIMVISTSFGGGRNYTACDGNVPAMTTAANNAVAAGITVLASSGNDGYCDSMGWPACISSVISVGAVYDANFGTYYLCVSAESCAPKTYTASGCVPYSNYYATDSTAPDKVPSYSNIAANLVLLAPANRCYTLDIVGSAGDSSGDYSTDFGGTSAACPYAAGAVACLQQAAKVLTGNYLSPGDVRSRLGIYGDLITDTKVAITKPRINLGRAIDHITTPFISVSPTALDFGTIPTGTTSQRVFVVSNNGETILTNGTATVTGGPFAVVSGATFRVPAHGSTNVTVRFSAVSNGAFTNNVIFATANGGASTNQVSGAGVVQLNHFAWSAIAATQHVGTAFPVTIAAQDGANNLVTNFVGTAALSCVAGVAQTNILGNLAHTQSYSGGNWTDGYSFTPNTNLTISHVRHYFGTKVSIWTDAGALLATQAVTSVLGTWIETPLATPLQLLANNRYRVAVYNGGTPWYYRSDGGTSFANGTINLSYEAAGDAFPTNTDTVRWWFVDLRYSIGLGGGLIPITPTNTGSFVGGLWNGTITGLQSATNVYLYADDGASHNGTSLNFSILSNPVPLACSVTPASAAICSGTSQMFTCNPSGGTPGYSYLWSSGETTAAITKSTAGIYTCSVTDALGSNTECSATLTVNPLPTQYVVGGGGSYCAGGSGVAVTLSGSQTGVRYYLQLNGSNTGMSLVGTNGSLTFNNIAVAGNYGVLASNNTTACTQLMTGTVPVSVNPLPTQYPVGGGGSYCAGGNGVAVTLSGSQAGLTYYLQLNGSNTGATLLGAGNGLSFNNVMTVGTYGILCSNSAASCTQPMSGTVLVSVNTAPSITANPSNQTLCVGSPMTMTVGASGSGPLSYQWRKTGTPIVNATNVAYTVASVTTDDAGRYDAVVSGACSPPATSAAATLTVQGAQLAVSPPALDFGYVPTGQTAQASFQVTNTGCGTLTGMATLGNGPFAFESAVVDTATKLLLEMDGLDGSTTFVDSSPSHKTVTANGNARQLSGKFNRTAGFFNGTSDYVVVPDSSDFDFSGGENFKIEFWVSFSSLPTSGNTISLVSQTSDANNLYSVAIVNTAGIYQFEYVLKSGGVFNTAYYNFASPPTIGTFYHVRAIRSGTQVAIAVNGTYGAAITLTVAVPDFSRSVLLGCLDGGGGNVFYFNGWLKDVAIYKNSTDAIANFTIPTSEASADSTTKLLMHFDTPATGPLGPAIYFDGTGDYLAVDGPDFTLGNTDFTQEAFVQFSENKQCWIWGVFGSSYYGLYFSGNTLYGYASNGVFKVSTSFTPVVGKWYHIVFERWASLYRIWIDGWQVAVGADGSENITGGQFRLGGDATASYFHGYIREFRQSSGGRYTTVYFTPPQNGFTVDSDTKLYIKGNESNGKGGNELANGSFESGTTGWFLNGSGVTAILSSDRSKYGTYSLKVTRTGINGNAACYFQDKRGVDYWKGRSVTLGAWVWSATPGCAVLGLYEDGIGNLGYSSTHPGDSQWHWLTVTGVVDSNATYLQADLWAAGGVDNVAYFDGVIVQDGSAIQTIIDYETTPKYISPNGDTKIKYTEDYRSSIFKDDGNMGHHPYPQGSAKVDFFSVLGAGIGDFDGSGDYLSLPNSSDWNFSGDLTIDFWMKGNSGNNMSLLKSVSNQDWNSASANDWDVSYGGDGNIYFYVKGVGNTAPGTAVPNPTSWNHIAIVKSGATITAYVNGTAGGTLMSSSGFGNTQALEVGRPNTNLDPNGFNGRLDNIRISKGIARWTSDFTPPDAPYSAIVSTNSLSFSVPPHASTNILINFTPTTEGAFSNQVIFLSNGGNSTNVVTGSGAVAPTAIFTAMPTNGAPPLSVTFADTSTGTITNRNWSFGDGATTNTMTAGITHSYSAASTNTVRLIATGPLGVSTNSQANLIVVTNTALQQWQINYFGCFDCPQASPQADPDGDGQNNEAEFMAGTCPTNSASAFRILSISPEANNLRITWQTVGGKTNTLQATGVIGGTYTNVSPNLIILNTGDTTTNWVDPGASTNWPARFYRILLVP